MWYVHTVPLQLFVDGKHVGNGEVIIALNESGKLRPMLERFEVQFSMKVSYFCPHAYTLLYTVRMPSRTFCVRTYILCMLHINMHTHTHTHTSILPAHTWTLYLDSHTHTHPPQTSTDAVCRVCGGQGFIMCLWCQGSKKGIRNTFGDLKCTVCNKNALQKCPECSM